MAPVLSQRRGVGVSQETPKSANSKNRGTRWIGTGGRAEDFTGGRAEVSPAGKKWIGDRD